MTPEEIKSYFERLAVAAATEEPQKDLLLSMAMGAVGLIEQLEAENAELRNALEAIKNGEKWGDIPAMAYKNIARSALQDKGEEG